MMLTRCPGCATSFRVSAEQLKLKQGRVRCGHCRQVFNALNTLVDEAEPTPPESDFPATIFEPSAHTNPVPAPEELVVAEDESVSAEADAPEPAAKLIDDDAEQLPAEANWPSFSDDRYATPAYERTPRRHSWLWGSAAVLAVLLLLTQALLHFRTELSSSFPGAASALREGCGWFGLDLPLPHKAELLGIETSDLHPGSDAQLVLAATLKNRAPFIQAYPHLELTLTDTADLALLRKVIAPGDYLPPGIDLAAGFAANGELAFNLALEASVNGASGYRIYLFYP